MDRCDYLLGPEKFEVLDGFISFNGIHIKELTISDLNVDQKILQKLLNLLPNLESLDMGFTQNTLEGIFDVKSSKIEQFKMIGCTGFDRLLRSLEKCAIKDAELECWSWCESKSNSKVIKHFLKAQEKHLKKLTIFYRDCDCDWLNDLKDLRLEYLDYFSSFNGRISLEFLKYYEDLKFLRMSYSEFSNETLGVICELKELEMLDLDERVRDWNRIKIRTGLNNLHKLGGLKSLKISGEISNNILIYLQFGIFNDLVELDASFDNASVECIRKMIQITPNLKKIKIRSASSDTINALLENLEHLESVEIWGDFWELSDD
jgi:hypothetical protein